MNDTTQPVRGIVTTPAEVANEGVDRILEQLRSVGANAVAISPGVFFPTSPNQGVREPPLDVAGEARILDRPLWGKKVQYLKGFSPYEPDPQLWNDVPFPAPRPSPDGDATDYAAATVDAARASRMGAYIIASPTLIPGLPGGQAVTSGTSASTSRHRLVGSDGSTSGAAVAGQGCVNDPDIRALAVARLSELADRYGAANGLFIDWAEYTCYLPEDLFTCFCGHCAARASDDGYDWGDIRALVNAMRTRLMAPAERDLRALVAESPASIIDAIGMACGASALERTALEQLYAFKAASVARFFSLAAEVVASRGAVLDIGANTFPPPWNRATGSDYRRLADVVPTIRCKLFTFHWPMMTRWMCDFMMSGGGPASASLVLEAVQAMYQLPISPTEHRASLEDYGMPAPDEPHPITMEALGARIDRARAEAGDGVCVETYLHSYRPLAEFEALLELVPRSQPAWIQRYGYLSDAKLSVLRNSWLP